MLSLSCQKDEILKLEDIVQTDSNGNIINQGNSSDWTLMSYHSEEIFEGLSSEILDTSSRLVVDLNVKHDCPLSDSVIFKVFPNPVNVGSNVYMEILSNKNIIHIAYKLKLLNNGQSLIESGLSPEMVFNGGKRIYFKLNNSDGVVGQSNASKSNFEVYAFVMTEDSCGYYTKGKILYN